VIYVPGYILPLAPCVFNTKLGTIRIVSYILRRYRIMTTEKEEQKIEKLAEKIKKLKIKKAT